MDNNYELFHHGVRGMKWGVRRYQNKDGSLTAAGKKRYEKEMARLKEEEQVLKKKEATKAKLAKLDAKRAELDERKKALDGRDVSEVKKTSSKKSKEVRKPPEEMDFNELQNTVNRLNLEARYNQLKPEKVSAGKRFVDKVLKDVVAPAATEVAKNTLKDFMTAQVKKATTKS